MKHKSVTRDVVRDGRKRMTAGEHVDFRSSCPKSPGLQQVISPKRPRGNCGSGSECKGLPIDGAVAPEETLEDQEAEQRHGSDSGRQIAVETKAGSHSRK